MVFKISHETWHDSLKKRDTRQLGVPASDYPLFFALVRLAKEEGFFKESGLDVVYEFYPHGVASLKAIQTGEGTV